MLFGVTEYDDATYFGSAVRLVHGVIPYRDFYLVQPPGLMVLLTPFAWLSDAIGTRYALGVTRAFMPLLAAALVVLVGRLIRHKGVVATVAGCAALALYTDAITSSHTLLLEPILDLFLLLALTVAVDQGRLVVSGNRALWAGVLVGVGGSVKLFAIAPALVFAGLFVWRRAWPAFGRFVGGTAIGFGAVVGPFLALDPSGLIHQVIVIQLNRQLPVRTPLPFRLSHLLGLAGYSSNFMGRRAPLAAIVAVGALLVLVVAGGYLAAHRRRSRIRELDVFAVVTSVLVFVMFLVPAEFYYHYGDLLAPFLALTFAAAVGGLVGVLPARVTARARPIAAGCGILLAVALVGQLDGVSVLSGGDPSSSVDSVVPAGGCTISDSPALLVTSDRLTSNVPGCPQIVDALGLALSLDNGASPAIRSSVTPALIRTWTRLLNEADYVVLSSAVRIHIPFFGSVKRLLAAKFSLLQEDGMRLYVRHGYPQNG